MIPHPSHFPSDHGIPFAHYPPLAIPQSFRHPHTSVPQKGTFFDDGTNRLCRCSLDPFQNLADKSILNRNHTKPKRREKFKTEPESFTLLSGPLSSCTLRLGYTLVATIPPIPIAANQSQPSYSSSLFWRNSNYTPMQPDLSRLEQNCKSCL